jgi:type II secretory pathway pseudopilin PulG
MTIRHSARPPLRPGARSRRDRSCTDLGFSLIELILVLGIAATTTVVAIPGITAAMDEYRTLGAARYVSSLFQRTRAEAVARAANTAVRFEPSGSSYTFTTYVDGNRNGVSTRDIGDGIDRRLASAISLKAQFGGVDFGTTADLPSPDGTPIDGVDPIRFGVSDMATFTAYGTATPGSVYIRGSRGTQYVLRVFGDTGKTHLLKFDRRRRQWGPV